jgi:hypothetical protein
LHQLDCSFGFGNQLALHGWPTRDLRNYVRALQQVEAFRNAELKEAIRGTGMLECVFKLKEQDNFSDIGFQVTIRHGVLPGQLRVVEILMDPVFRLQG